MTPFTKSTHVNPLLTRKNKAALESASDLMRLLSNPHRLTLLCHLGEGEMAVGDLAACLGMSPSALSQHLSRLKEAEIVTTRREHNKIYYALKSKETKDVIKTLKRLYCAS